MEELYAVRNIRLCTKDCLCLYVCPTGASDTENSIIDKAKCIGCGKCANACPSKAISMVPRSLPPQQKKADEVVSAMKSLMRSKSQQESIASALPGALAEAMAMSNRIMAEDIIREAGFMLPQSANTRELLRKLLSAPPTDDNDFTDALKKLLETLDFNEPDEKPAEKWKCQICGHIHEGALPDDFECPICHQPKSMFERIE